MNNEIFYCLILVIIIVIFLHLISKYNGTKLNGKAYGEMNESLEELINRIDYANRSTCRHPKIERALFTSLGCTFLISLITELSIRNFFLIFFFSLLFTTSFSRFFDYHSDKFPVYGIDRNIRIIRKKFGLRKRDLKDSKRRFRPGSECFNYSTVEY